jgi:hypothetical protein
MADINFTSEERMDIYRRLFLLNRSFHLIVMRLDELKPLFTAQDLKDMRGMTQEIQLGINTALLDSLDSAETMIGRNSEKSAWQWKRDLKRHCQSGDENTKAKQTRTRR